MRIGALEYYKVARFAGRDNRVRLAKGLADGRSANPENRKEEMAQCRAMK
jgi:hypothetical protein